MSLRSLNNCTYLLGQGFSPFLTYTESHGPRGKRAFLELRQTPVPAAGIPDPALALPL